MKPKASDELSLESEGPQNESAIALTEKLLKMSGTSVVIPFPEEEISELILTEGALEKFASIELRPGKSNDCHGNCALLWKKNPRLKMVTGYALSSDGYWRRHTWMREGKNGIETTEPRSQYFGITLTDYLAKSFVEYLLNDEGGEG